MIRRGSKTVSPILSNDECIGMAKRKHWQLKSSLFTGGVKTPVLFLLCAVNDNICAALPPVTEERKRTQAERDAFNTFIERVQAMDTDHHSVSHPQQMPVQSSSDTNHLQQVRDAYATTVMAVPHYEEDYDDILDESMTEEFDEEIAVAVSSGQQLSPPLKRHLLQAASAACERRTKFLKVLEQEKSSIRRERPLQSSKTRSRLRRTSTDRFQSPIPSQPMGALF